MASKRSTAAEVTAQRAAQVREDIARAAPEPKPSRTGQVKTIASPALPIVQQTIEGTKEDAPLMGEVVLVPRWAERIHVRVPEISGPANIQLRGALANVEDWTETLTLIPMELSGFPGIESGYRIPPAPLALRERATTPAERSSAITNTKMSVVEATNEVTARMPQFVRVLAWPLTRKPVPWSATVEIGMVRST